MKGQSATPAKLKHILDILRPSSDRVAECKLQIGRQIAFLETYNPNVESLGPRKKRLEAVNRYAKQVQVAVKRLTESDQTALEQIADLTQIDLIIIYVTETVNNLNRVMPYARGGKNQSARLNAERKRVAAECALTLIKNFGNSDATLTADGVYFRVANGLYERAFNKRDVDLKNACALAFRTFIDSPLANRPEGLPGRVARKAPVKKQKGALQFARR